MKSYMIKIWVLALGLTGIHAFCASDDITLTHDKNYYNPQTLSLRYILSVPSAPLNQRYRLLLHCRNRKSDKRTTWADIELPCKREHDIYFFMEKDCIRIYDPEHKTPDTTVTGAKISIHVRGQTSAEYSLRACNGYIRYAEKYSGKTGVPIDFLEFFYKSGPIPMHGKNIMNFNFGDPVDFDPFDLILEIRSVDIPKKQPPAGDTKIDFDRMKQMNLSELKTYQKTMEEKYLAGEINIKELNSIQSRINELYQQSR